MVTALGYRLLCAQIVTKRLFSLFFAGGRFICTSLKFQFEMCTFKHN